MGDCRNFQKRAAGLGLKLDLEVAENKRIYGERRYRFLGDCKAVIGVEAGVSIFDLEDQARLACEDYLARSPTPRSTNCREKCCTRGRTTFLTARSAPGTSRPPPCCCQILYEGDYSGVLKPMVHYIPLKKDFSNFDHVISMYRDASLRKELTENSYRDLIASGKYTYRQCVEDFDRELVDSGMQPEDSAQRRRAAGDLGKELRRRAIGQGAKIVVRAIPRRSRWLARTPDRTAGRLQPLKPVVASRAEWRSPPATCWANRGLVPPRLGRGFQRGRQ